MKKEILLYNGTVKVYFEEKDWNGKKIHLYTNEKGEKIESNTGATGIIDKSDGLIGWAVKLMGLYLTRHFLGKPITDECIQTAKREWRRERDEAADIGTKIHEFAGQWITLKKKPEIPEEERVRNGVIAFLKFIKENNLEFICSERIVYSKKHKVIGRLDAISYDIDDGYLTLDDFKSSSGIYPEMILQTAGYLMMIEEEIKYLLKLPFKAIKSDEDKRLVELYKKCGGFKKRRIEWFGKESGEFIPKEFTNHKKDVKGFIAALETKKRVDELKNELKNGKKSIH
jgi:hypothetical protein